MSKVLKDKDKLLARVNRILGQTTALKHAIETAETDTEFHKIMHQMAAIRGAMTSLLLQCLDEHTRTYIAQGTSKEDRERAATELMEALRTFCI